MTERRFSWHNSKAERNKSKHRITFETATRVFADPYALSEQDRVEGGEYRWRIAGLVDGVTVIVVAYSSSDDSEMVDAVHIISARRADRSERLRYEQERRRLL